jgi:alcohol dehydrogenase class IV
VAAAICARTGATRLRDEGVEREALAACAEAAAERAELALTPPAAGRDELLAIYQAAW